MNKLSFLLILTILTSCSSYTPSKEEQRKYLGKENNITWEYSPLETYLYPEKKEGV